MDAAGARALAQRIAEGKPVDDARPETPPQPLPSEKTPPDAEAPEVDVVYFHPETLPGKRRPWVYVRRSDGRLHRSR
jgi:hypothetical protein